MQINLTPAELSDFEEVVKRNALAAGVSNAPNANAPELAQQAVESLTQKELGLKR